MKSWSKWIFPNGIHELQMNGKVIYILGHERSGSTLFHNILGQSNDIEALGELRHYWKRAVDKGNCGCGKKVVDCEYWQSITDQVKDFDQRTKKHIPERFFPVLAIPIIRGLLFAFWKKHIQFQKRFYAAVFESKDVTYIVDSSKSLVHFYLLTRILKLEVVTIQILRHPCGIEYSLYKRKEKGQKSYSKHNYLISSILSDFRFYFYRVFLKRYSSASYVVKYEDLIRDYETIMNDLKSKLSIKNDFPSLENGSIFLNQTHTVGGSPSRLKHGDLTLREDNEWSEKLPQRMINQLKSISIIYKRFYKKQ